MSGKLIKSILIAILFVFSVSCKSSQKFPTNEAGVIVATQSSVPKSAVRLKGEIVELKEKREDKKLYLFKVTEVLAKGGTFGTVLPKKGEVVVMSAPAFTKFKDGVKLMVDAVTPLMKEGEMLSITML